MTEADFEKWAWSLIRQSLLEDRQQMLVKMAEERLRQSGRYNPL